MKNDKNLNDLSPMSLRDLLSRMGTGSHEMADISYEEGLERTRRAFGDIRDLPDQPPAVYECPTCSERFVGEKPPYPEGCYQCHEKVLQAEAWKKYVAQIMAELHLDRGEGKRMRFKEFRPGTPEQGKAMRRAIKFAKALEDGDDDLPKGLYLWSPINGVGKSHLATSIVVHALNIGMTAYILNEPRMMTLMRDFNNDQAQKTAREMLAKFRDADIAVWDDAGRAGNSEKNGPSGWYQDTIWMPILEYRSYYHKPIIVTANISSEALRNTVGSANFSRLASVCDVRKHIHVIGKDWRLR